MSKRIFLFPGQGSQKVGMAADLIQEYSVAKQTFEQAADVLGFDLAELCAQGPEDELKLTQNAQPALLVHSIAALRVLEELHGIKPEPSDYVAGHSLGEYSALVASGVIAFDDAVKLVRIRGEAMIAAVPAGQGAMAALVGAELEAVENLCKGTAGVVVPANMNGGGQIVISGEAVAVKAAVDQASSIGAKRAIMLPVSGPFHSPLMQSAADKMQEALASVTFNAPVCPVIANVTAQTESDPEKIKSLLVQQVTAPVRWEETMSLMTELNIDSGFEVGAGKVLTGLLRRGAPGVQVKLFGQCSDF